LLDLDEDTPLQLRWRGKPVWVLVERLTYELIAEDIDHHLRHVGLRCKIAADLQRDPKREARLQEGMLVDGLDHLHERDASCPASPVHDDWFVVGTVPAVNLDAPTASAKRRDVALRAGHPLHLAP
jgi:hypothetical protein